MIALGVLAAVWLLGRQLESKGLGNGDDASSIGDVGRSRPASSAPGSTTSPPTGRPVLRTTSARSRRSGKAGSASPVVCWPAWRSASGRATARASQPAVLLTCAAPAIPLAQAIGRWGNWFNQELFGRATDLPWGLEIDDAHTPAGVRARTRRSIPTFLYESLWNLGLVARAAVDRPEVPARARPPVRGVRAWATASAGSGSKGCASTRSS